MPNSCHEAPARYWKIDADGVDLSGEYIAVEVLNIRFVGPNLPLAPEADPSDGMLDVVLVGEADRKPLLAYIENRLHLASGQLPDLRVVPARSIEMIAPAGVQCHLDDQVWPLDQPLDHAAALSVSCQSGAATFVGTAADTLTDWPDDSRRVATPLRTTAPKGGSAIVLC